MRRRGYTLMEVIACLAVLTVLFLMLAGAGWKAYEMSCLATSANNIRQLAAGAAAYLAENDYRFWDYCESRFTVVDDSGHATTGTRWWFGFESDASKSRGEGRRRFDPSQGPLAGYIPQSLKPDPSFALKGRAFKSKYESGYLGVAYNVVLAGGWTSSAKKKPMSYWDLSNPGKVVVFATGAQVNTFQSPATTDNPMLEEFYGIDEREKTVHFRHGGMAMVAFADGSCDFLPMDKSTRDNRMPEANVGRFAPRGSFQYLK